MPEGYFATAGTHSVAMSVAALSLRLGVPASTLRTWERRYGLGASNRQVGAHRRYTPEDVERLARMVDLVHSGIAPADAAALVLRERQRLDTHTSSRDTVALVVDAAHEGDVDLLTRLIERSRHHSGLVRTWTQLIEPAFTSLRRPIGGEIPGVAPSLVLTEAVLHMLREHTPEVSALAADTAPAVIILTDGEHLLCAHVLGVALREHQLDTRLIEMGSDTAEEEIARVGAHLQERRATTAFVMGRGAHCEELVPALVAVHELDVILVGADAPTVLDRRVQRVRTLGAAVEEALSLDGAGYARAQ